MHARFELSPMMRPTILSSTNLVLARSSRVGKLRLHPLHDCTCTPSSYNIHATVFFHLVRTPPSSSIFNAVFSLHLLCRLLSSYSTPSSSLFDTIFVIVLRLLHLATL